MRQRRKCRAQRIRTCRKDHGDRPRGNEGDFEASVCFTFISTLMAIHQMHTGRGMPPNVTCIPLENALSPNNLKGTDLVAFVTSNALRVDGYQWTAAVTGFPSGQLPSDV